MNYESLYEDKKKVNRLLHNFVAATVFSPRVDRSSLV